MAGEYNLKFSDPFKIDASGQPASVVVPSATNGSGINNYDTSLDLVGAGYVNYGIAYAQNFLKLLENFASPYPPENAIEGQVWYDTSDSSRKVLRVSNGTATSSRWMPTSGIYQQSSDPADDYNNLLVDGDIWVDTSNSLLKIRYGTGWRTVGPDVSEGNVKTGSEFKSLQSNTGTIFPVILNWANNKIISIISNNDFTPKIVQDGFPTIKTGVNLTNKNAARYYGIADKADSLYVSSNSVIRASDILKNRTTTYQIHTGTLKIDASNGLYVNNSNYNQELRLKSDASGGLINFSDENRNFKIGINDLAFVTFNPRQGSIGINTSTNISSPSFEVYGNSSFVGTLTLYNSSTTALEVNGFSIFNNDVTINADVIVNETFTATKTVTLGSSSLISSGVILKPKRNGVYDIGEPSNQFRHVYANRFGTSTNTATFIGSLIGTATKLATKRQFSIRGQITTTNTILFDGSSSTVFTATLHKNVFLDSAFANTSTTTGTHSLLVYNTASNLNSIEIVSKTAFLAELVAGLSIPGTIVPFAGNTATVESSVLTQEGKPAWLLCVNNGTSGQGRSHTATYFSSLYAAITDKFGDNGGGTFRVPDMTTATNIFTGRTLYYIIKT